VTPDDLLCANPDCDRVVLPDEDHVRIEGHLVYTDDREQRDDYFAHHDCWREITARWRQL